MAFKYRPILCYNVSCKIISKMLCMRLKEVLPKFIMPSQVTFVKARMILPNIMIGLDFVSYYRRKTISPRYIIKVDIIKTDDEINSDFWWR